MPFSGKASAGANTGTTSNGGCSTFLNLWDTKRHVQSKENVKVASLLLHLFSLSISSRRLGCSALTLSRILSALWCAWSQRSNALWDQVSPDWYYCGTCLIRVRKFQFGDFTRVTKDLWISQTHILWGETPRCTPQTLWNDTNMIGRWS